jgi:antitoxin component of RelBE/YafQ-DinJ toxin-antitoxin module
MVFGDGRVHTYRFCLVRIRAFGYLFSMKKKLTLSIDDRISARAKRFAQQQGTSVSELVETYLAAIASRGGNQWEPPIDSITASLFGVAKDVSEICSDYKHEKERMIQEKYAMG